MIYTPDTWPDSWPNFTHDELRCSHTGECDIDRSMMDMLQQMRNRLGIPLHVTSGYRHPTHPAEASKDKPGTHSMGKAVDIACIGGDAYRIVKMALLLGFQGIGVSQSGSKRFIHLDNATPYDGLTRPAIWSY